MIVFIIGPAAVGKSHFCKCWQKLRPEFIKIDDLPVVIEYIELDKIIVGGSDIKEVGEKLCGFLNRAKYLKSETREYLNALNDHENVPAPRFTKKMGGGFRAIADPNVWDEMMRKISIGLSRENPYLVEFARSIDPDYLKLHGILEREIYLKSIECFIDCQDWIRKGNIGIVHIGASFDERRKRNLERHRTTGRYLPEVVLEKVFRQDAFFRTSNDLSKIIDTEDVLIGGKKVSVFSIMNDLQMTPNDLDRFFNQVALDAIKHFGI